MFLKLGVVTKNNFLIIIADCEFWKNCQTAMYCR